SVGGRPAAAGSAGLMPITTYCRPYLFLGEREKSARHQPPARAARSTCRRGWPVVAPASLGLRPVLLCANRSEVWLMRQVGQGVNERRRWAEGRRGRMGEGRLAGHDDPY